jgi:formylglycine-generating enzyme required for sulfatase activity
MSTIKWFLIIIGTIFFATLAINAVDNIDDLSRSLVGSVLSLELQAQKCPKETTFVSMGENSFCIDKYEASTDSACLYSNPRNQAETDDNLALPNCTSVSVKGAVPWRNIARHQAELACAKAKKRLPTSKEWYRAALGTIDKNNGWGPKDCNVNSVGAADPDLTGARDLCVSAVGAYDMVGNVWEWTEETVYDGEYGGRKLPATGYISSIDDKGIPLETNEGNPDASFFYDHFWLDSNGARGMFRGGYWGNKLDAGQYTVNASIPPSFIGNAVGFRCAMDVN